MAFCFTSTLVRLGRCGCTRSSLSAPCGTRDESPLERDSRYAVSVAAVYIRFRVPGCWHATTRLESRKCPIRVECLVWRRGDLWSASCSASTDYPS
ncbi:hypothetical protein BC834DRAFT_630480 [Gloeopeniophorella convolvens]|nr:hypothetical protein BC834DRAFT_630480 [Gloeopeniophorella convolvens]